MALRKNIDLALRIKSVIPCVFAVGLVAMSSGYARALELYVMRDAPNAQTSPAITEYSSIANFRSNTSGTTTARGISQGSSCDFTIVNGAVYYMTGDATATDVKAIVTWPSVADWAANTNFTPLGTRTGAVPMAGMAIYQNQLYVLEGSINAGVKTLRRWASIASWVAGDAGTALGTRSTGSGFGFDIDTDGIVYFLDTENVSPNTATSGILYSWPTISNFLADSSTNANGGSFTFFAGSPNEIAGLAIVPEPSTWMLAGIAAFSLPMIARHRAYRNRGK